ncbi:MAG: sensor hybrid histidine kinase [Gemmatimonadetes bacterium]|nr:sensor hybrid histidine kinase [Gemmatimonadota bacterium]
MLAPGSPPVDENARLAALRRAELLDTPPEEVFDRLTHLASALLHVPVAVVSFVDEHREFFKSAVGIPHEWVERRQTPRGNSLAEIALLATTPVAIEDAREHPLVKNNPIMPEWGVVSYAAVPLRTRDGYALGSVYVADRVPRIWTDAEIVALSTIAKAAETEIELRIALKETERARTAMQTMLERVPYAVLTVDHEWRLTFANRKAESLMRSTCTEVVGQPLWAACPHVIGSELEEQLRQAKTLSNGSTFEGYLASLNSWYEAAAEPSVEGLTVFFKDVTAKRQSHDALLESERRYRFVFEEGLTANIVSAPDGQVLACNQAFVTLFGFSCMDDALKARADSLWFDPLKREETIETLRKHGRFGPTEVQSRRADGTTVVSVISAVARFDKGELTEVHSCILDITEQKKLEAQFRQSQKMEAVGQLAGGMAHDFNNLLTVIKAYVQLAMSELEVDAPVRADMKVIGDAADRAAELTRQLLAYSRQQVLLPQRMNFRTIITGMKPMIHALLGPEITLVDELDPPVPDIEADRSQIEQVLMNLAVNARDAMPKGGTITFATGEETISTSNSEEHECARPGSYVTLAVRDSGVGMSPETVAQIFEPFFTTKGPGKGTGLGLSTVYGIVKQSGGHLKVTSVLGSGTTFTLFLPAAAPLEEEGASVTDVIAAAPDAGAGRTVLVVEDDAAVRRALIRSLSRAGYSVLEASNGTAALEIAGARQLPFDLLISDVEMPELTGPALAVRIRTLLPLLPVLFVSGNSNANGSRDCAAGSPPYRFLAKPFTLVELMAAVHESIASGPVNAS